MILFQPYWGAEGRFLGAFSLFLQVESSATKKGCFRHAMQRQCYLLAKASLLRRKVDAFSTQLH